MDQGSATELEVTAMNTGCHKCPHTAAIMAGKFDNVPFSKTPCAVCVMTDLTVFNIPSEADQPDIAGAFAPYLEPDSDFPARSGRCVSG